MSACTESQLVATPLATVKAPWQIHDAANVIALPMAIALVVLALRQSHRWGRPLALYLLAYIMADTTWIIIQPEIVRAPVVLLLHHAATLVLLLHALSHEAHLKFVGWLSCVELNTYFLILRRHIKRPTWAMLAIRAAFIVSWLGIRVIWFPMVAAHLWTLPAHSWPSPARRGIVAGTTTVLALLQLMWTRDVLRPLLSRLRSAASHEERRRHDLLTTRGRRAGEGHVDARREFL